MNLNVSIPINSVSFGFLGYNILKQLYIKGYSPSIFPIGNVDLSSFDRASDDFKLWLQSGVQKSLKSYSKKNPELSLWHIGGSERSIGERKYLISFMELDNFTEFEINIIKNQEHVFFTSEYTVEIAKKFGLENVAYLPLGFDDENFHKIDKNHYGENVVTGLIAGKAELRKQTKKAIQCWVEKFGNNPNHRLHLSIYNNFLNEDQNRAFLHDAFQGKSYWNVNYIPYVKTLTEFNQVLNSADYVIDMSGGESWSIPSFSSVCLGKHAILHNVNGIKSWANKDCAVLIEPSGKQEMLDGVFFHPNSPFNRGNIFTWDENEFKIGLDKVVEKVKLNKVNSSGLSLQKQFTWDKTVNIILDNLK